MFLGLLLVGLVFPQASMVVGQAETWSIAEQPQLTIGGEEAGGATLWAGVVGVVRLTSGEIVVADGMSREVRWFDETGSHLTTTGGLGQGPGEFRTMRPPMRCGGEEVLVWDPAQGRVSIFDRGGRFVRQFDDSFARTIPGFTPWKMTCNDSGVLAVTTRRVPPTGGAEGPVRLDMGLVLFNGESVLETIGPFPGDEFYFAQGALAPRPLGMTTTVAVGPSSTYVGTADSFAIDVYGLDGRREGHIREALGRQTLTDEMLNVFIESKVRTSRNETNSRRFYARLEFPRQLPAYRHALLDDDENLWIEEYPPPGQESSRWRVYSPAGVMLATLMTPAGLTIFEIGTDYVLGVWRDELDVESVRLYSLTK